jgi:protease-4
MGSGLIDAIGGEAEALDWLEAERQVPAELKVETVWPPENSGFDLIGTVLGGQARAVLGLPEGPIPLDGLISLWQVGTRAQ